MSYAEFLSSKQVKIAPSGFSVPFVNEKLFEFQRDIALWLRPQAVSPEFVGLVIEQQEAAKETRCHYALPRLPKVKTAPLAMLIREG